jgi:3-dehydroquinate synthase
MARSANQRPVLKSADEMSFSGAFRVDYSHSVTFTHDCLAADNPALARALARVPGGRIFVVAEKPVLSAFPRLRAEWEAYAVRWKLDRLAWLALAGGERLKTDGGKAVARLQSAAVRVGMRRSDTWLAIGGGALQDAAGYAAATFHRGVALVRVPTTVLAQCDSAMGVKNGIDLDALKNGVGTFAVPSAVVCDLSFLRALPDEAFRAGFSEAVKVGAVRDRSLVEAVAAASDGLAAREASAYEPLVVRSARLHFEHIVEGGDPFERGTGRPLDFGHWLAHRLEEMSGYRIGHGRAVAAGVWIDAVYARRRGLMPQADLDLVRAALLPCGLQSALAAAAPYLRQTRAVEKGLDEFRDHLGGELSVALPAPLGRSTDAHDYDRRELRRILRSDDASSSIRSE